MKRTLGLVWVGLAVVLPARADAVASVRSASREEYRQSLGRLEALVVSCRLAATACDPAGVGDDLSVEGGRVEARFDWLRGALGEAKDVQRPGREALLTAASDRLRDEAGELDVVRPGLGETPAKANEILGRAEFRHARANNVWQRWVAAGYAALDKLFAGTGRWLPRGAWLAPALEWGVLGLAAAGLLLWAWRVSRQERLRVVAHTALGEAWVRESDDWAARAEAEAARAAWREAVHSLYWSAIVMLEGQRLWARNRARTPREYVALLEPGSDRRRRLGGLTTLFERLWYGLRPASQRDFEEAKALRDAMRAG